MRVEPVETSPTKTLLRPLDRGLENNLLAECRGVDLLRSVELALERGDAAHVEGDEEHGDEYLCCGVAAAAASGCGGQVFVAGVSQFAVLVEWWTTSLRLVLKSPQEENLTVELNV
jgi:hypothetical protein